MTTDLATDKTPWHLDRKVPMAIIIALAVQAGSFIWWASGVENRALTQGKDMESAEIRIEKLEDSKSDLLQRLTAVETQLANQTKLLDQILAELRRS